LQSGIVDTTSQSPLFADVVRNKERLSMNARVFLVVLLTAIFMAVWDADQKAMEAALARKQHSRDLAVQVAVTRNQPRRDNAGIRPERIPAAEVKADPISPVIPLPRNLADGTWQAISESGAVYSITIDRAAAPGPAADIADVSFEESFAIFTPANGDRWCFVRSHAGMLSENRRASTVRSTR
jgi:hypothetical protein